jgi:hypothetical protein
VRRNVFALILIMAMAPIYALAATPDQFRVRSTADLVEICSTPANDALYPAAMGFCQGFAVGAYQYYHSSVSGPQGKPFVCLPASPPHHGQRGCKCLWHGLAKIHNIWANRPSTRSSDGWWPRGLAANDRRAFSAGRA